MSKLEDVIRDKERVRTAELMDKALRLTKEHQKLADEALKNLVPDGKAYAVTEQDDGSFIIRRRKIYAAKISAYSGQHDSWYLRGLYAPEPDPYNQEKIESQSIEPVIHYETITGDQVSISMGHGGNVNTKPLPMKFNVYQDAVDYIKRITKRPEEKETYFNANGELVS